MNVLFIAILCCPIYSAAALCREVFHLLPCQSNSIGLNLECDKFSNFNSAAISCVNKRLMNFHIHHPSYFSDIQSMYDVIA